MKKAGLLILLMCFVRMLAAQDSTSISYSEQKDSLAPQLVVDKYEKIFMTMVPTRHMFKVGLSQYYQALFFPLIQDGIITTTSLHLGYEVKVLPSFSLALSGHLPFYAQTFPLKSALNYTVVDAQLRWFVDMKKRIRSGTGVNNFSGNYLALNYTATGFADYFNKNPSFGVKAGFQRRVLNSGFMDFAMAMQQRENFYYGLFYGWTISTQATVGFAIGDWKKTKVGPLCDFLLCDPLLNSQWKLRLPEISFGFRVRKGKAGIAYEKKIGSSPFSLNYQFDIGVNSTWNYMDTDRYSPESIENRYRLAISTELDASLSIQPRYYLLQNRQRRNGRSGNGLSGLYAGIHTEYNDYRGRHNIDITGRNDLVLHNKTLKAGPMAGFQQRLFQKGYLDFNASYNLEKRYRDPELSFGFTTYLGVGLAF
ncbi:hypothetical protein [Dyadobacter psychrotolerans]|uniref:DUF4421 domain-containing protein n=1 Tax=Dyadobacter psychrotolerans TaxID=2541721 RepID=A0A4V6PFS8_9BACT|nr:hypothetical protein [Dyadobacter psychrotolerans]TDE14808.1 hypothetical protein E0F88_16630 [Dyadobacter psychrotolerans]